MSKLENILHGFDNADEMLADKIERVESDIYNINANIGGKNIVDLTAPYNARYTNAVKHDNGSFTFSCSSASWTQYDVQFNTTINKKYIFYVDVSEKTGSGSSVIYLRNSNNVNYTDAVVISTGKKAKIEFVADTEISKIFIYVNNNNTAATSSFTAKIMIYDAESSNNVFSDCIPSINVKKIGAIDLDYIINSGRFFTAQLTTSHHAPETGYYFIDVMSCEDGNYVIQTAHCVNRGYFYIRQRVGGTWQSWYKYTGTVVS